MKNLLALLGKSKGKITLAVAALAIGYGGVQYLGVELVDGPEGAVCINLAVATETG